MIKAVIFDLGGVVVDYTNHDYYIHIAEKAGIDAEHVREVFEGRELDSLERGKMNVKTFEERMAVKIGMEKKDVGWYDFFIKKAKVNFDVQEIAGKLHDEYVTAFISNIDRSRYNYTRKMINLDLFDYKFTSCYIGYRKPDRRIYEFAVKRMRIKYENAVFIDDMAENIDSAEKLGINGVMFKNRRGLDVALYKLGL